MAVGPDRNATVRVEPASLADDPVVGDRHRAGRAAACTSTTSSRPGGPGEFRTTEPMPVDSTWKTLVRVHKGSALLGAPVRLPEDEAIPAAEVPLPAAGRGAGARARPDDPPARAQGRRPGWLWSAGVGTVLVIWVAVPRSPWPGASGASRAAAGPQPDRLASAASRGSRRPADPAGGRVKRALITGASGAIGAGVAARAARTWLGGRRHRPCRVRGRDRLRRDRRRCTFARSSARSRRAGSTCSSTTPASATPTTPARRPTSAPAGSWRSTSGAPGTSPLRRCRGSTSAAAASSTSRRGSRSSTCRSRGPTWRPSARSRLGPTRCAWSTGSRLGGVTTVYPGYIRTPIHDVAAARGISLEGAVPAEPLSAVVETIVRVGTAERPRATPPRPVSSASASASPGSCRRSSTASSSPSRAQAPRRPRSPRPRARTHHLTQQRGPSPLLRACNSEVRPLVARLQQRGPSPLCAQRDPSPLLRACNSEVRPRCCVAPPTARGSAATQRAGLVVARGGPGGA